jgi:hypothetical protein
MMSPDLGNIRDRCKVLLVSRNIGGTAAAATTRVVI